MSQPWILFANGSTRWTRLGHFVQEFWPLLLTSAFGLLAIYLLLPRPKRYPTALKALVASLALIGAGSTLVRTEVFSLDALLFYVFSFIAIVAGSMLITLRNPVYAALSFAMVVLSTCGLFLLQAAPFLMAATMIIYAGAIIVTFLFVIMLAQQTGNSSADHRSREPFLASLAGFVLLTALLCVLNKTYGDKTYDSFLAKAEQAQHAKDVNQIKEILGKDYTSQFLDYLRKDVSQNNNRAVHHENANWEEVITSLLDLNATWLEVDKQKADLEVLKKHLTDLVDAGNRVRYLRGNLQPSDDIKTLSTMSGPAANVDIKDAKQLPRDKTGNVKMPSANVTALGKALFTDYLLSVELAGTILLVATIGAIAIAARRPEGLR